MFHSSEETPCPVCGRMLKIGHTHIACSTLREEAIRALMCLRADYRRELLETKRKAERLRALSNEYHELMGRSLSEAQANYLAILAAPIHDKYRNAAGDLAARFIRPCDDDRCEFNGGSHPHEDPHP